MNIGKRLKLLRKQLGLTQTEFGEKIGLKQTAIGQMEGGTRNITERTQILLKEKYSINLDWLVDGIGEMFIEPEEISLDEYARKNDVSDFESDIMKFFMSLDKELRNKIMQGLREIALKSVPTKNISVVKKERLSAVAESQPTYAAHNVAEIDDEETKLMKQDLDEL